MEMEHINENLIRINISFADLEERGVNFIDLLDDRHEIERFFYSILEEIDIDAHFQDSEAVTFQVMPNRDGLELYISRSDYSGILDSASYWSEMASRGYFDSDASDVKKTSTDNQGLNLSGLLSELLSQSEHDADHDYTSRHDVDYYCIKFNSLEDFIMLAREQSLYDPKTDLYYMDGSYYLVINSEDLGRMDNNDSQSLLLTLMNFGEASQATQPVLVEHGELIRKDDALGYFGHNL